MVKRHNKVRNSFFRMKSVSWIFNCIHLLNKSAENIKLITDHIEDKLFDCEHLKWKAMLERNDSVRGTGGNNL